jgi:hypothetical protein
MTPRSEDYCTKICSRCRFQKSIEEFGLDPRYFDGHASVCRKCSRDRHVRLKPRIELAGKRVGRLLVIDEKTPKEGRNRQWNCVCDCGAKKVLTTSNLTHSSVVSCGCFQREHAGEWGIKHGACETRTYRIWKGMKTRCTNFRLPCWRNYGGRGITVCQRWMVSFEAFIEDMGDAPVGLTLERINNDGNYEPGNCCWATRKEQRANQRPYIPFKTREVSSAILKGQGISTEFMPY